MTKRIVQFVSAIFPELVVNFALNKLANPQIKKLRENELETLDKAHKEWFEFKGFQIQTYTWGTGPKKILLIHGWEGQAGNFSDLIERLLSENYQVFSFDGPSHGFSSKGRTSLFEFTELVGVLIKKFKVDRLISHSFGGVATTYALFNNPEIEIEKYSLLTTPDKFSERIADVSTQVGISKKAEQMLIDRLEKDLNLNVAELNVSTFVQHINVKSALIIHDKKDRVISIAQSKNVHDHWPNCEFEEIEGTGHFRILRSDFVIDRVIRFLAE